MTAPSPLPLALYVHWPFCLSKCPYCDFNSHVAGGVDHDAWRTALLQALDHDAARAPNRHLVSIFFGGGTPSLMAPATVAAVIERASMLWPVATDLEITLEANPTSVEAGKFRDFRAAGVNRLSLGVQALDDAALRFLGRGHSAAQAQEAIALAARFFPRFSFDLIYAYAGQTRDDWQRTLTTALTHAGDHLSLYQLTLESGTAFHRRAGLGEILTVDADLAAVMFDDTQDITAAAGLPAYEISNHARADGASRHNLVYWQYDDFIGIGPGAHGRFVDGMGTRRATASRRGPDGWLQQVQSSGHGHETDMPVETITARDEALMMGLRLHAGIDRAAWWTKFGDDVTANLAPTRLAQLKDEGLITLTPTSLAATARGRATLNALLGYLRGG